MSTHRKTLVDGTIAGLLGGLAVAVWFVIIDVGVGKPLTTPSLLGSVLLRGTFPAAGAAVSPRLVIDYTALHFLAFTVFGIAAAWLLEAAERHPAMLSGVVLLFACFEFFFLLVVGAASTAALELLIWWRIVGANLLATLVMLGFFATRHHRLAARLIVHRRHGRRLLGRSLPRVGPAYGVRSDLQRASKELLNENDGVAPKLASAQPKQAS